MPILFWRPRTERARVGRGCQSVRLRMLQRPHGIVGRRNPPPALGQMRISRLLTSWSAASIFRRSDAFTLDLSDKTRSTKTCFCLSTSPRRSFLLSSYTQATSLATQSEQRGVSAVHLVSRIRSSDHQSECDSCTFMWRFP